MDADADAGSRDDRSDAEDAPDAPALGRTNAAEDASPKHDALSLTFTVSVPTTVTF